MFRNISGKSFLLGAAAVVVFLKVVAPRVSALQGVAAKLS